MNKLSRAIGVFAVTGMLAVGGATAASASTDATPELPPFQSVELPNPDTGETTTIKPGESRLYVVDESGALSQVEDSSIGTSAIEFGPCDLYPSTTYLRSSYGYGAVGAKPYTECDTTVTKITHSANLYTVEWHGGSHLVKNFTGSNYSSKRYQPTNISWSCVNKNSTRWWTITTGTIIYAGTTYYAQVATPIANLKCGRY